jgi:Ala-tRNA(Pro) deacylase
MTTFGAINSPTAGLSLKDPEFLSQSTQSTSQLNQRFRLLTIPMPDFYQFLAENRIEYERHDHPPVYTVEEAGRLVPALPAAKTKNLFLRDKKGLRHFLVVVPADKRVDLKALPRVVGSNRLSFGSAARLKKYLGVEPGSVSLFAIFNDPGYAVELIVDESLWHSEAFQFHPLVNTSTLVISCENLKRFIAKTGHEMRLVDVPSQE